MKIENKTLSEIFFEMPWTYKIVVTAGTAFILFSLIYVPYVCFSSGSARLEPGPITITGIKNLTGSLDPSVATDGKKTILSFTAIQPQGGGIATEVRMAAPNRACASWAVLPSGFLTREEELIGPDGINPVTRGSWRIETPSIVYDPSDRGREWKLYAYKYFWSGDKALARLYGFIVYSYASDPFGQWSTEEWILSATPENPPLPYAQIIQGHINNLNPSLSDVYFYSRPSVLVEKGVLFMTLSAYVRGREMPDRVVLLVSTDHGKKWFYAGTPLRQSDLSAMGPYTKLAGATLLREERGIYLAAVLGDAQTDGLGTFIIPFSDIAKGLLARDKATGVPFVENKISRVSQSPTSFGGGFAAYTPACPDKIMVSEFSGLTKNFHIFKTYQTPVER